MPLTYENLLKEAHGSLEILEKKMGSKIKGLYADNIIWINRTIPTTVEKACVLAEELGHYYTSYGDILDQTKIVNRKQEKRARNWAYEKLIPLSKLIEAYGCRCRNRFELAEYLNVTEEFLEDTLKHYKEKYGLFKTIENYVIYFEPLGVLKIDDKFF